MGGCPSENVLVQFGAGRLAGDALAALTEHLDGCDECRMTAAAAMASTRPVSGETLPVEPPPLLRGAAFGRYTILEPLGAGAMGVVYAAYDAELDRKVAIKLLVGAGAGGPPAAASLLTREAKAMARVSHPAVVAVFDAGIFEGRAFVAMELVRGETLGAWRRREKRAPREIAGLFVQCGRGLAAAHAAGLVHRDFKPDNVIVTADGRAKVTDFGLARSWAAPADEGVAGGGEQERGAGVELTRSGVLVGTPAYMAPEQLAGRRADARADQWSFCVALHEALTGQRPFAGDSLDALRASVSAGLPGGVGRAVPAPLRAALQRGLSLDPEARFARMDDLVAVIDRFASPRVARWRLAGAAAALAALSTLGVVLAAPRASPCAAVAARGHRAWDGAHRDRVRAAFLGTGRPFAADAWAEVDRALLRHVDRWGQARVEACEATRVRAERSEESFDLRMRCLERQLDEMDALTALFSAADGEVVENAVAAAYALPRAVTCAEEADLGARRPLPRDPAARRAVEQLDKRVAGVRAQRDAARYAAAAVDAHALVTEARGVPSSRLLGEVLFLAGDLDDRNADYDKAADALRDAELAGVAAGDDETALAAAASLVQVTGYRLGRDEESRFWDRQAQALLERAPGARAAPLLHVSRGQVANVKGRYEEALGHARRALDAVEQRSGPDDPEAATARTALAQALTTLGRHDEALQEVERAIALRERLFGSEHPLVARTRSLASHVLLRAGDPARALTELTIALRIQERVFGADGLETAYTLNRLGNLHAAEEDYERALVRYRQVLEVGRRKLGDGHTEVGLAHMNLAICLRSMGRAIEAEREYEEARAIVERTAGPDQPYLAAILGDLGTLRIRAGKVAEGEALHRRALALGERAFGPAHPDLAEQISLVAEDALRGGRPDEARALAERALGLQPEDRVLPRLLADLRFTLARSLGSSAEGRERARQLAARAREGYGARSPRAREDRARVDAWLAAHP